jgi:recombination protein RecA
MAKEKKANKTAAVADDKEAAVLAAMADINKRFGAGTLRKVSDRVDTELPVIPTGIYQVDNYVIGVGGIPRKRITEVYGPESGGKTTLTLAAIAEAQAAGGKAAFVDAEHALDGNYASALGVDVDELLVCQPDYGEQALEVTEALCRSGAVDLVVVDSVAALVPLAELNGEMGDSHVGLQARLMSQALRKLTGVVSKTNTALVFINQIREKVGVMYGNPETTTGGRALKFYASVRLDVRRKTTNTVGDEAVSNTVTIKGAKNKLSPPYRKAEVDIEFGKGFDKVGSVVRAGVDNGAIAKSGSWYSFGGERYQGEEQLISAVTVSAEMYQAVYAAVLAKDQEVPAA